MISKKNGIQYLIVTSFIWYGFHVSASLENSNTPLPNPISTPGLQNSMQWQMPSDGKDKELFNAIKDHNYDNFISLLAGWTGKSALVYWAIFNKQFPYAEATLKSFPKTVNEKSYFGCTPLYFSTLQITACGETQETLDFFKLLLTHNPDLNTDCDGTTVAQLALQKGLVDRLSLLIKAGAQVDNALDQAEQFKLASRTILKKCAEEALEKKLTSIQKDIDQCSNDNAEAEQLFWEQEKTNPDQGFKYSFGGIFPFCDKAGVRKQVEDQRKQQADLQIKNLQVHYIKTQLEGFNRIDEQFKN